MEYNGKKYCVSQCAKDKFQQFVLSPIIGLFTIMIIMPLVALLVLFILGFIGMLIEGVLVVYFDYSALYRSGEWLLTGTIFIILFLLLVIAITYIINWLTSFYKYIKAITKNIDNRIQGVYIKQYKKKCTFFIECK